MAATVGKLVATLTARTAPFERGMKRAKGTVRSFTRSLGSLGLLGGAAGLGVGFVRLVRSVEDFNRAMKNSLAIMGDVSERMKKDMQQAAIDVARVTVFSAKEAAEAYFFLASAGLNAAQSLKALPAVAAFAQAGMFAMARATDLLTDAQSALGLSVNDTIKNLKNMTRVSDVLVKANTIANASVEQFSEALTTKAGAAIRILGKEIEEAVAVLAVFADQGIKGALAGTGLSIVLRDLSTKAIKFESQWKKLNVAVFDSAGEMRNMADIIADLERALDGMSDKTRKATLLQLGFSDKSVTFVQSLLGMSEKIRAYQADLESAAGITQEIADKQMTALQSAVERLKAAFVSLGTEGSGAMTGLATVVNALAVSIEFLGSLIAPIHNAFNLAMALSLKSVALLVRAIAAVAKAIDIVIGARGDERFPGLAKLQALAILLDVAAEQMGQSWAEAFVKLGEGSRDGLKAMEDHKKAVDELTDSVGKLGDEVDDVAKSTREQTKWQSFAERLFDNTRTALERYEIEIGKLNEALERGVIDWELYQRGVRSAREALEGVSKSIEDVAGDEEARRGEFRQVQSFKRIGLASAGDRVGSARRGVERKVLGLLKRFDERLKQIRDNQSEPVFLRFDR